VPQALEKSGQWRETLDYWQGYLGFIENGGEGEMINQGGKVSEDGSRTKENGTYAEMSNERERGSVCKTMWVQHKEREGGNLERLQKHKREK